MRVLFSGTPAYGHVLPHLPLARAFRRRGDAVALLTAAAIAPALAAEDIEVLPAGSGLDVLIGEVVRRTGADPLAGLTPEQEAEAFAGVRVDLCADESTAAARAWKPDLVVSEHYDFVGPLVGAALGVPVAVLAFGPAMAPDAAALMEATVSSRYAERGLAYAPPHWYLDTCPPSLQIDTWQAPAGRIGLRPQAHRGPGQPSAQVPAGGGKRRPRVLVTFGTIFSAPEVLTPLLRELASADVEVRATTGPAASAADFDVDREKVSLHGFTPLHELLRDVDVAVTHGGAGSTLGILAESVPLVVVPQAADHFVQADRVRAAGAGIALPKGSAAPATVAGAVAEVLAEPNYREGARKVAAEIMNLPSPAEVAEQLAVAVM